jgi:hypothetical protein
MRDSQAPALRIAGKVCVSRELIDEGLIECRYLALAERDAIEQADDALGDRAQVVLDLGSEGDHAERLAAALIRPGIVALEDQLAVPDDDDGMQVGELAALHAVIEQRADVRREAGGFWRDAQPIVGESQLRGLRGSSVEGCRHRKLRCYGRQGCNGQRKTETDTRCVHTRPPMPGRIAGAGSLVGRKHERILSAFPAAHLIVLAQTVR